MVTIRIGHTQEDLPWEEWEQRVRQGRIPETAHVRFEPVTGDDFVQASELDLYQSLRSDASRRWSDSYRSGPPPWMTALIAGIQIQLWWLLITAGTDLQFLTQTLVLSHAKVLEDGQIWRVLSMGVLHLSPLHITANLAMLIYVGWNLERALGRLNLLTIFVGSVVGGSLLSLAAKPGVVSLGSSGGVLGMVAAATVFGFVRHSLLTGRARLVFGWALLPYLALIYLSGWSNESTDNWAHTGGLVAGALLAVLLDPPGLERRKGWSLFAPAGVGALIVVTLGALYATGPRLLPVRDVMDRVERQGARRPHRELVQEAPVSWLRGSVQGRSGFVSQANRDRGWVARQRELSAYTDLDTLVEQARESLRGEAPELVTFEPAEPLADRPEPGVRLIAHLDEDPPMHVELRIYLRGMQVLETLWSVEEDLTARLATVHERCQAGLEWNEPLALLEAQAEVDRRPRSRTARRELAEALTFIGQPERAHALLRQLVEEQPAFPDGWSALIAHAGRVGGYAQPPQEVWSDALERSPHAEVASEVAMSMHAHDERALAYGTLELAWARSPGDRTLRRARRIVGLPTRLSDGQPAHLLLDPITGHPRSDVVDPQVSTITLEEAERVGQRWMQIRDQLRDEVLRDQGITQVAPLLLLHRGLLPEPEDLSVALSSTLDDIRLASRGLEVRWLDPTMVDWATRAAERDPDWLDELRSVVEGLEAGRTAPEDLGLTTVQGPDGPLLARAVAPLTPAP